MTHLLYCVTEAASGGAAPANGVGGAAVESVIESGLRCYYSVLGALASDPESIRRDALDFHKITRMLFEQAVIIPFRFPTLLASVAEIGAYLNQRSGAYHGALQQFRETVQMEVRVGLRQANVADAGSGTAYLESRAQHARRLQEGVKACRAAINEEVIDWRQREATDGVRCFLLVRREALQNFQQQIKQVRLEATVNATVSGPWPPTEFLPDFE
jgi:hypothetical protein